MTHPLEEINKPAFDAASQGPTTPTGVQPFEVLRRRRLIVLFLNLATYAVFLFFFGRVMSVGGWSFVDCAMFVCAAFALPWAILGLYNGLIGLWLLHFTKAPLSLVAPYSDLSDKDGPLEQRTAVLMTLRNEEPDRALARLEIIKDSIDATGNAAAFDYFILSDTSEASIAERERELVEKFRATAGGPGRIVYRRREDNTGFKAGNVRDFCNRWGDDYEFMLPLDADSLMSGDAIVKLVRTCQAHPHLGILQSLVCGTPADSAFARIFQFGMRHGMRTYTMGQAWWTGDCGPFWGHNAVVRIAPFRHHCTLPLIDSTGPFSGHVLSHDQIEAVLMRRAGFEVRVLPVEFGSWEDNPPTILDYAKREERWCQGNLQYTHLLGLPDLKPVSRFQLVWAILMFASLPAGAIFIALLPIAVLEAQALVDFPTGETMVLYFAYLVGFFMPKLAGFVDIAWSKRGFERYGGGLRFTVGAVLELIFSFLQGAVTTLRTSIFMIALIVFGRSVHWGGQDRDTKGIKWATAFGHFWPQTLFGVVISGSLFAISPAVFLWSLPVTAGYILAIPFAVLTASPALGALLASWRLCAIPEEYEMPSEVLALKKVTS